MSELDIGQFQKGQQGGLVALDFLREFVHREGIEPQLSMFGLL